MNSVDQNKLIFLARENYFMNSIFPQALNIEAKENK